MPTLMLPAYIVDLEDVSARAWPARVTGRLGGWRLNACDGYTGRANTCWCLEDPGLPAADAIEVVEAWYQDRGLPAKFKLTDGAIEPPGLEAALVLGGYEPHVETCVMTGPVGPVPGGGRGAATITETPDAAFQSVLFDALYRDSGDARERLETVERIMPPIFFARVDAPENGGGEPAAIGACAVEGEWAGISLMRTRAAHRRKGLARQVLSALLGAAAGAGATRSYLQVEADNTGAIALYKDVGFNEVYRYRYWSREAPAERA